MRLTPMPLLKSFVGGFGEAEVGDAGKALLHAIVFVRFQQLQGAQDPQLVGKIAAYFVLPTFAASEREQHDGGALAPGFQGQHAAILVVRMGGDVQDAGGGMQLAQD